MKDCSPRAIWHPVCETPMAWLGDEAGERGALHAVELAMSVKGRDPVLVPRPRGR